MNVALTGHSKGIGKALLERLPKNTLCFSRSNGYDISKREDRDLIVKKSLHCDIFINNAHSGFSQVELLKKFAELWKNDVNKMIINMGSWAGDQADHSSYLYKNDELPGWYNYWLEKQELKKTCSRLWSNEKEYKCKIVLVRFGIVNTDKMMKSYGINTTMIDINNLVDIIDYIIKSKKLKLKISDILILKQFDE